MLNLSQLNKFLGEWKVFKYLFIMSKIWICMACSSVCRYYIGLTFHQDLLWNRLNFSIFSFRRNFLDWVLTEFEVNGFCLVWFEKTDLASSPIMTRVHEDNLCVCSWIFHTLIRIFYLLIESLSACPSFLFLLVLCSDPCALTGFSVAFVVVLGFSFKPELSF